MGFGTGLGAGLGFGFETGFGAGFVVLVDRVFLVYQLVLPAPPARVSEMCMWLRCRSEAGQDFRLRQPALR